MAAKDRKVRKKRSKKAARCAAFSVSVSVTFLAILVIFRGHLLDPGFTIELGGKRH
jgi:hypothetical protein